MPNEVTYAVLMVPFSFISAQKSRKSFAFLYKTYLNRRFKKLRVDKQIIAWTFWSCLLVSTLELKLSGLIMESWVDTACDNQNAIVII